MSIRRKQLTEGSIPVEALTHEDTRVNIPTADAYDFVDERAGEVEALRYPRNPSLDPQLVWKGKDAEDAADLVADAPPIYIQEKIDPRVLIENLRNTAGEGQQEPELTLFDSFDGLEGWQAIEFYRHSANWSNRMILGDSLHVMASLALKENLRGQVQMIYVDPPYGINFRSNWQASTRSRDVKDGKPEDATREVEQIKAFRDTWQLGINSYLSYLRDRLSAARHLLTDSGSIFVQIGDENVHLVRSILDEVFGRDNFVSFISFTKAAGGLESTKRLAGRLDYLLWYAKDESQLKYRPLFEPRTDAVGAGFTHLMQPDGSWRTLTKEERSGTSPVPPGRLFRPISLTKPGPGSKYEIELDGRRYNSGSRWWGSPKPSLERLITLGRVAPFGNTLRYISYADDFPFRVVENHWQGLAGATDPVYVVQTNTRVAERCLLMTTDPGDLVLDPTCGSGTTAYVAEQWGRRWIAIDTSRIALALTRQRLMGAQLPYFLLADSPEGRAKEEDLTSQQQIPTPTRGDVRKGFVYERVPHITLASIANNTEIREGMTGKAIEAAIARRAETELLFDRPYEDRRRVRVAGPFTVESLSPHHAISLHLERSATEQEAQHEATSTGFEQTLLDNLIKAGVQNGRTAERLRFERLSPYPGKFIQAEGTPANGSEGTPQRVAVSIGPQYGTVNPHWIKDAAREALKGQGFDLLLVCGFAFDPRALETVEEFRPTDRTDFASVQAEQRLGRLPVLLVRMNPDLAMGDSLLKKTGAGNLFTVFGEPDVKIDETPAGLVVQILGVDVYNPTTGEIRSSGPDEIAMWMIDTAYNEESFFVRHCYFTGGGFDPYARLKRTLKADIGEEAWASLYAARSRPFPHPASGQIAVKVINHYGDEVLKVYRV
jgi:adenine-specific DNA-methyltransferase